MTLFWPMAALPARDFAINPSFRNTRGAASIATGAEQITASDAGRWKATLGGVRVGDGARRKLFRALQSLLEGGLTPILIPLCGADQPFPAGAAKTRTPLPHGDGSFFSDGTGYAQDVIAVTLAAGAARRATELSVTKVQAGDLEPSHHFSIGERLYRIKAVQAQSASAATLTIWPPLREAVPAGAALRFDSPVCRMRLASDQEMDLELALRRSASLSIRFVEAL